MVLQRALRRALLTSSCLFLTTMLFIGSAGWFNTGPGFYLLKDGRAEHLFDSPEICLMDDCVRSHRPLLCLMEWVRADTSRPDCTRRPLRFRLVPETIIWPVRPGHPI